MVFTIHHTIRSSCLWQYDFFSYSTLSNMWNENRNTLDENSL